MSLIQRASAFAVIAAALISCSAPPADSRLIEALPAVRDAITTTTGYDSQAVELMASSAHVRVLVSDEKLAAADQVGRENAATAIAGAVEKAFAAHPEFSSVQVISVAIIHPAPVDGAMRGSHVEDVLEFRKGPNQRFAYHTT